jgi:biopolymer transport protein ExbD
MKKLFSSLLLLAFMVMASFAQVPAKSTSSKTAKTTKEAVETKQTAVGMKKDGTPDKRFKANQAAKPAVAGPTKKDGTADMRYKANKTKPAKM